MIVRNAIGAIPSSSRGHHHHTSSSSEESDQVCYILVPSHSLGYTGDSRATGVLHTDFAHK